MARNGRNKIARYKPGRFRLSKSKHNKKRLKEDSVSAVFSSSTLQNIRQHARQSLSKEICGVLIGQKSAKGTVVEGTIEAEEAAQGEMHVTFTQDAWVEIHQKKSEYYPNRSIVGWYHSHPGFGVFLSEHDIFIHRNFFNDPSQLAWVYDPHSDEEGCFGWMDGEVQRLRRFEVITDASQVKHQKSEVQTMVRSSQEKPATIRNTFFSKIVRNRHKLLVVVISIITVLIIVISLLMQRHKPFNDSRTGSTVEKSNGSDWHSLTGGSPNNSQEKSSDNAIPKKKQVKGEA